MLDGVEADSSELQGLLHRRMQVRKVETLQKTENLHVLTSAMLCHAALHQPAQRGEFLWQVPPLERRCMIQRIDLLLDQRQVKPRHEDEVFTFQAPGMADDDIARAANHI